VALWKKEKLTAASLVEVEEEVFGDDFWTHERDLLGFIALAMDQDR